MIVVLDTLVISFWLGRPSPHRLTSFLTSQHPRSRSGCATYVFFYATGIEPVLGLAATSLWTAPLATSSHHCLLPSIQLARSYRRRISKTAFPCRDLAAEFSLVSVNYFSGASVAALILPYLLQTRIPHSCTFRRYFACSDYFISNVQYALGRIEDANTHLE